MTLELNIKAKRYIKSPHVKQLQEAVLDQEHYDAQLKAAIANIQKYKKMYTTGTKTLGHWDIHFD
jgi:hypothetical protein